MATEYETVVGMEVHVELETKTKVFCGCSTKFGAPPNTQVCPVCLGMPGSLPVINKRAFEYAMRVGLALQCEIAPRTQFERKNYYYPDLPKNYQISQLRKNLGEGGQLEIRLEDGVKAIGIHNIHLEEDAGKNIHPEHEGADYSLVDLNRAGTALLEIVSEPDLRGPEESLAYMDGLKNLLQYTGVSSCNMHEGRLRFEANISVRPKGSDKLGTKVEVKNLNSTKIVLKCIEHETRRQIAAIEAGERIRQETRLWDEANSQTLAMRSKEEAQDYRYFPDPDLVEVVIDEAWIEKIRAEVPELPAARANRFREQFDIPEYNALVLTGDKALADYYEEAVALHDNPKSISNWMMTEILRILNEGDQEVADLRVRPSHIAGLVRLIDDGTISGKIAKTVFKEMEESGAEPAAIVEKQGLAQISDSGELEAMVDEVLAANEKSVADLKAGKDRALKHLMGQVMKASRGKANPQAVQEMIKNKLAG